MCRALATRCASSVDTQVGVQARHLPVPASAPKRLPEEQLEAGVPVDSSLGRTLVHPGLSKISKPLIQSPPVPSLPRAQGSPSHGVVRPPTPISRPTDRSSVRMSIRHHFSICGHSCPVSGSQFQRRMDTSGRTGAKHPDPAAENERRILETALSRLIS